MMDLNNDDVVSCSEYVMTFMAFAISEVPIPECDPMHTCCPTTGNCNLIAESSECGSENSFLGYTMSLKECSLMCIEEPGCEFFLRDPSDGECLWEQT
jgi:hypothetical protein